MRRDQGISSAWSFLLGFVLLTLIVPGVLIGPAHAIRIIASAIAGTVLQGSSPGATEAPVHQLPVVDLHLKDGPLMYEGVRFPIEHQPFGKGHEIRSVAEGNSPFGPFDRFTITRPRNADVIGGTLANWIAGRMGVAVPYKSLVQLQIDGGDAGIHEVTEAVTGEFERDRNLTGSPVAVFRSDRSQFAEGTDPWRDVAHWQAVGTEDEEAAERFGELIGILNDSLITMAERRAQLEALIDAEAFNLYHAAIRVLGVPAEEWIGTAVVLSPRTGLFYPVLIDAPLVPGEGPPITTGEHDMLASRMMDISDWRTQRDALVREAITTLHAGGEFNARLEVLAQKVAPSLAPAAQGRRPLFSMADPNRSVALEWSSDATARRVAAYWDQLSISAATETGANITVP